MTHGAQYTVPSESVAPTTTGAVSGGTVISIVTANVDSSTIISTSIDVSIDGSTLRITLALART